MNGENKKTNTYKELYETSEAIRQIDYLFENEEIDESTYNDTLEMILSTVDENIDNLYNYYVELEAGIKSCEEYVKTYSELKNKKLKKQERLKEFMKNIMQRMNKDSLKGNIVTVAKRKSSFVDIKDETLIPSQYKKEKVEISIDKKSLSKVLKEGTEIPGVSLGIRENINFK